MWGTYLVLQQDFAFAEALFISASLWQDAGAAAASFFEQHSFLVAAASVLQDALAAIAVSFLQQVFCSLHSPFPPV